MFHGPLSEARRDWTRLRDRPRHGGQPRADACFAALRLEHGRACRGHCAGCADRRPWRSRCSPALLVVWAGAPVGRAYLLLFDGAFGSRFAMTETLTRATPLILTGLAAAVAFRAQLYNIGAEGQLYVGALAAVAVAGAASRRRRPCCSRS